MARACQIISMVSHPASFASSSSSVRFELVVEHSLDDSDSLR